VLPVQPTKVGRLLIKLPYNNIYQSILICHSICFPNVTAFDPLLREG
jgi:hypothetical protein